ncbi:MAG: thiolase family protein [Syntrophomonadaceae bacterium]|nr:thiolase family protein [Syntrophomonadaceae bacterium]
MREAVIVGGVRTAVGKAPRGALKDTRPEEMAALVIKGVLAKVPVLNPAEIEDVIFGCAFPEGEQGMNIGRVAALRAGLPVQVAGQTVNRFCASGLQAVAIGAQAIMTGMAEVVVAGGVESMSLVPMGGNKLTPDPYLVEHMPQAYLSMGLTAEKVAKRYGITREDQDRFALASHRKAAQAINLFQTEIIPLELVQKDWQEGKGVITKKRTFDRDEGVRGDTSLEALAALKPAFHAKGSVTAGNSSQTSDGAAGLLLMTAQKAASLGVTPLAVFRSFAVAGVEPEVMGIGPVKAIPKALSLAGVTQDQVDLYELNEAFAAQALAVMKELELDGERVNVNGGAIALGHPLGCTGAKLTVSLLGEMQRRGSRFGVVSMCIGGGMGAAAVFERTQ